MILICGASGLVGKEMCSYLDDMGVSYIGTYNKNKMDNMFKVDFSNPVELESFFLFHKIRTCIFCIVERLTDICEQNWNEIRKTNIDLVHITSYVCNQMNIKFIHLSTDYVFDGSVQPNYPYSNKNPLQNYGISKLISEHRVIKNCTNYCIIRTPVLYSPLSKIHDNAVCLIGKNVMDLTNKIKKEDNYSIRRPLYIKDLCAFIYDSIHLNGIYHFYNPYNQFTKYEICNNICSILDISNNIVPVNGVSGGIAPRPYDTQLCDDLIDIDKYKFHDFDKTLLTCFGKFKHDFGDAFICIDMDGTLIDSNMAHYNAYKKVFERRGMDMVNMDKWNHIISHDSIDNYLKQFDIFLLKEEKREALKDESISFTTNSEVFLKQLIDGSYNFCIVTNANQYTVNLFKEKLPLLKDVKQWIVRDDYTCAKPSGECYELAKERFYKQEKYIVGIEDTMVGYTALKSITDVIYIYKDESIFKTNDCYLFDDYLNIL